MVTVKYSILVSSLALITYAIPSPKSSTVNYATNRTLGVADTAATTDLVDNGHRLFKRCTGEPNQNGDRNTVFCYGGLFGSKTGDYWSDSVVTGTEKTFYRPSKISFNCADAQVSGLKITYHDPKGIWDVPSTGWHGVPPQPTLPEDSLVLDNDEYVTSVRMDLCKKHKHGRHRMCYISMTTASKTKGKPVKFHECDVTHPDNSMSWPNYGALFYCEGWSSDVAMSALACRFVSTDNY